MTQQQIVVTETPQGALAPRHFALQEGPVPTIEDGQLLTKTLLISIDAAMRAWLAGPTYRSQVMPGEAMPALVVAEVVESRADGFAQGDIVIGNGTWSTYSVMSSRGTRQAPPHRPLSHHLSILGIAGLTAYFGLLDIGKPEAGETVVVSAAAGAVGSIVGQIAKAKGCRVVGIAGGPEKGAWIQEALGFDAAIDYKAGHVRKQLREACPDGFHLYFDNVGGQLLEDVLFEIRNRGRIVCCGAISQYDTEQPASPRGVPGLIVVKRLRLEGFVVMDYFSRIPEAARDLLGWHAAGQLNVAEDVVEGLARAPEALIGLFDGSNRGKRLVRVAPDPA